jgi:hypothetical protein
MALEPTSFNEIAHAHLQRDLGETKTWTCECEACRHMRSLVGMEKMLEIWPLVNQVSEAQHQIERTPDGAEKEGVVELYHNLSDQLATKMAE